MLNNIGGYIVIGVQDDLQIIGIKINKNYDLFIRSIDDIYHNKLIMSDKLSLIDKSQITHSIRVLNGKNLLAIKITPLENEKYQLYSGVSYTRLGASNLRCSAPVYYPDTVVTQMLNHSASKHSEELNTIQKQFNKHRRELEEKMDKLKWEYNDILFRKILQEKEDAEKHLKQIDCYDVVFKTIRIGIIGLFGKMT